MARPLRLEFSGAVYHITAHGDRREPIFLDDADRLQSIDLLSKEVKQRGLAALRLLFDGQPLPPAAGNASVESGAWLAALEWRLHSGLRPCPWPGQALAARPL